MRGKGLSLIGNEQAGSGSAGNVCRSSVFFHLNIVKNMFGLFFRYCVSASSYLQVV